MADGDLALFAALLPEAEDPLSPLVLEISSPQTRDGADPGPGVGQGPQEGPIAETYDGGGVDQVEELTGLGDGEPGSLAV